MLHRPPSLARGRYKTCRAPFRSCMIAAPRCYCLLSHYPFFDLHFRVRPKLGPEIDPQALGDLSFRVEERSHEKQPWILVARVSGCSGGAASKRASGLGFYKELVSLSRRGFLGANLVDVALLNLLCFLVSSRAAWAVPGATSNFKF